MAFIKRLVLFSVLALLIACQSEPAFVGKWELVSLELAEDEITATELGNPVYFFNKDHTYSIEVTGLSQHGTWELEGTQLKLKDNDKSDEVSVLNIVQSEESIFHYTAGEGETVTNVILKRAD